MRPESMPRVVMFTRAGCQACAEGRDALERVCEGTGAGLHLVDVDAYPELAERLGALVPVVEVEGETVCEFWVDAVAVGRRLATVEQ